MQVVRHRQGNARAGGREGRVGHHVLPQRLDERDPGVFAAAPAVGTLLVLGLGLEGHAEPLDTEGIAVAIEEDPRHADARVVAPGDEPREEVELSVRAADDGRVEDALGLLGIRRLGSHDGPQPAHLESAHDPSTGGTASVSPLPPRHAMIVSITSLVSSGPRTGMQSTPACSAG